MRRSRNTDHRNRKHRCLDDESESDPHRPTAGDTVLGHPSFSTTNTVGFSSGRPHSRIGVLVAAVPRAVAVTCAHGGIPNVVVGPEVVPKLVRVGVLVKAVCTQGAEGFAFVAVLIHVSATRKGRYTDTLVMRHHRLVGSFTLESPTANLVVIGRYK